MSILPHTHPGWCDPRLCNGGQDGIDHRDEPLVWSASDHRITVGRGRLDEIMTSGEQLVGREGVVVHIEDEQSVTPEGRLIVVELDLTVAEARMLAATLGQVTERISVD